MIPTPFGMLGFAKLIYFNGSLKNGVVYSENESVALPLNPTYVDISILFSNPRLIIKLTLSNLFAFPLKIPYNIG